MIVRILGEGQLQLDDSVTGELNELDAKLEAAVESGDEPAFRPADLILPQADATRDDVRKLMTDEGLIAG